MLFCHYKPSHWYLPLLAVLFIVLILSACGGTTDCDVYAGADADNGTGELSFNIAFQDSDQGRQRHAAVTDCGGLQISSVEAMVYDQDNKFLAGGGPWPCNDGQGNIDGVLAGSGRTVVVLAKNGDGELVFRGQKAEVNIVAEHVNNVGMIKCQAFVPSLKVPAEGSLVIENAVRLSWDSVESASDYQIIISENNVQHVSSVDYSTPDVDYTLSGLTVGETYYWRVVAKDIYGNAGVASPIWSFKIDSSTDDITNLLLDPTFSKTTTNSDNRYWHGNPAMAWGASYGYNSTPGFRIAIDGNENSMANADGNSQLMKHPVKVGDRLWIQFRLKRSAGADGTFRVGIQEWDGASNTEDNVIRDTITDISTTVPDETWELVTASVTVYDESTLFCNLLIYPHGGTTGYFYIDDVVLSHQEPAPSDNATNLLADPDFSKTASNNDQKHWSWPEAMEWGSTYGYNSTPGIRCAINGEKIPLSEMDPHNIETTPPFMRHPVQVGDRLWIKCRIKRSADADGIFRMGIQERDKDHNFIVNTLTEISTYATNETWELVSASFTVYDPKAAFCHLLIYPRGGTTGYFYIDDVFFSHHDPSLVDNTTNLLSDPSFNKTTPNEGAGFKHWYWSTPMALGPDYGYNSSPGFRCDMEGGHGSLVELDAAQNASKHPVKAGDKLWFQCRVKRSAGTDGVFRAVIREFDARHTQLGDTAVDVATNADDDTWEVVTTPITIKNADAAYSQLIIWPYDGTTGYFYLDDVVLSRHSPY